MHSKSLNLLLLALTTGITGLGHESTPGLVARRNYIIPDERTVTYFNSNHEFNKNSLKARSNEDALTTAANHLEKIAPGTTYRLIPDHYTDDDTGVTHAYFIQTFNGIDIEGLDIKSVHQNTHTHHSGMMRPISPVKQIPCRWREKSACR